MVFTRKFDSGKKISQNPDLPDLRNNYIYWITLLEATEKKKSIDWRDLSFAVHLSGICCIVNYMWLPLINDLVIIRVSTES